MRNPVLALTIAFVLAVPCIALAQDKHKDWIEVESYSHTVTQPTSAGKITRKPITVPKPIDTASPLLMNKTGGGSTGPTKPPLPTTAGRRQ
jgi:Type VI secretion system effector, Hcp